MKSHESKKPKKNGEIYISPLIFGDNAVFIQGILNGAKQIKKDINLNNEGGKNNAKQKTLYNVCESNKR